MGDYLDKCAPDSFSVPISVFKILIRFLNIKYNLQVISLTGDKICSLIYEICNRVERSLKFFQ